MTCFSLAPTLILRDIDMFVCVRAYFSLACGSAHLCVCGFHAPLGTGEVSSQLMSLGSRTELVGLAYFTQLSLHNHRQAKSTGGKGTVVEGQ